MRPSTTFPSCLLCICGTYRLTGDYIVVKEGPPVFLIGCDSCAQQRHRASTVFPESLSNLSRGAFVKLASSTTLALGPYAKVSVPSAPVRPYLDGTYHEYHPISLPGIVHFATHSLLNQRALQSSFLPLTLPNGLGLDYQSPTLVIVLYKP